MKTVEEQYWTDLEAGYKVTYAQADAEAVTAEDGRVILMDEHLADSDAMDYDMDRCRWRMGHYLTMYKRVLKYWIMAPESF